MKWQTVKTVVFSAVGGALVWWIVLAAAFGWMSHSSTDKLANERSESAVVNSLIPVCVAQFEHDAERDTKLAALKQSSSWMRDDFVDEQGWTTMPGTKEPKRGIAQECANRILANANAT
jgi:hypothetical protein